MFKKNVGTVDRVLRFVLGVVMLGAYFLYPDLPYRVWLWIGVIPLVTSLMSSCPIYTVLGLSTCPLKKS